MKTTVKKLLSLVLVLCTLVGCVVFVPAVASAAETNDVPSSAGTNTGAIALSGSYFFKVGAKSALADGSKVTLTAAPFISDGKVYIPVEALNAIASPNASAITTVNGTSCVALSDIGTAYSGFTGSVSNMKLICVSTSIKDINDYCNDSQVTLMKKFLFATIDASGNETTGFSVSDIGNTTHPYILADQDRFDDLAEIYTKGNNGKTLTDDEQKQYDYITELLISAKSIYNTYAQVNAAGEYTGMNTTVNLVREHQNYIYQMPYSTTGHTDGYDPDGGRQGASADNNTRIMKLAFAYQITRDINYAKLAYQYAYYMGQWEHWGPSHYLNCADASFPYAIAYDWLYQAWTELANDGATYTTTASEQKTIDVGVIEEIIFTHSIVPAMYSASYEYGVNNGNSGSLNLPWVSYKVGVGGYNVFTRDNNWSAVCTAGVIVSALAIAGKTNDVTGIKVDTTVNGSYSADTVWTTRGASDLYSGKTTYQDYATYLINHSLYSLCNRGLGQYVPDGSYVESNSYWEYGTNALYSLCAALTSATGSHYGVLDAWGMDTTAYFALNTMSSDGISFNYHDSNSTGALNTSMFMYLGNELSLNDKNLAAIRKNKMIGELGQAVSYYDVLFYVNDEYTENASYGDLQWYMQGIDGYAVRDSWNTDEGTLYGAFLGGKNNITHGQVDSGSFVYYNKGTRYFCDLGTEDYNAAGFWSTKNYYAMSAEGNNTVFIQPKRDGKTFDQSTDVQSSHVGKKISDDYTFTTDFYGQGSTGGGNITATGSNANGAYAIMNNTSAYKYSYSYSYSYSTLGFKYTNATNTVTVDAASSAYRAMLLTNDRNTFVIQDEITFTEAQDATWVAHTLPNVEIALSVDGKTAYLSDGKSAIRVTLLDPDNKGLTFRAANCTEDNFLLTNTYKYNYSENNGGVASKDYSAYQMLIVEAKQTESLRMAVVIEEVPFGSDDAEDYKVGYEWKNIADWSNDSVLTGGSTGGSTETANKVADLTLYNLRGDDTGDTPFIPFGDETSAQALYSGYALTKARSVDNSKYELLNSYEAKSFDELEKLLADNPNTYAEITLYASNTSPIEINNECTIDTNGYSLRASSDNYVITKNTDGSLTVGEGSVTVTWHLRDGSTKTETYTKSQAAKYPGTIAAGNNIYEVDNGDGTYSYYTTGNAWAKTNGGKQLSDNDMIVTSDNCEFWQTGIKYTGAFVTVSADGTITGYENANDLLKNTTLSNYAKVSLTSDVGVDGTTMLSGTYRTIAAYKTLNFYLNGYTLTYSSSTTSAHMFNFNSGSSANFYGPGMIRNEAANARIFYTNTGRSREGNLYVENVDFYGESAIIDHRSYTATFKDCDFTIPKNFSALGVINRNNVETGNKSPKLIVDGCTFNMTALSATNGVISLLSNCEVTVTGGTTVKASAGYLFVLQNNSVNNSEGTDAAANSYNWDISAMRAIVGDVNYSGLGLYKVTVANSEKTQPSDSNIYYGEGFMTDANKSDMINQQLADSNLKFVHLDATNYVLSTSYATVKWTHNGNTVTTYWADGTVPETPSDFSASTGKILIFNAATVTAGSTYNLTGSEIDSFGLKINMSLQSDFNLNFYVEKKDGMSFMINGEEIGDGDIKIVEIGGVSYYKIAVKGISPATAGQAVTITVTYGGNTITKSVTAIQYLSAAIEAEDEGSDARRMLVNIVKYIEAAYVYSGNNVSRSTEYNAVKNLYSTYKAEATYSVVDRADADSAAVREAITGGQFWLGDTTEFRFNIRSGYSGSITFTYDGLSADGTYEKKTMYIANANGIEYISIPMKAYYMLNDITITTDNGTCTYSLANYYHGEATRLDSLTALLNALYSYCETAQIYQNNKTGSNS